MELQKGHEDLRKKEPSVHSSYGFPGTATLDLWLDQTYTIMVWNDSYLFIALATWTSSDLQWWMHASQSK